MHLDRINNIEEGMRRCYPVSDSSIEELAQKFTEKSYPKGHLLTRAGIRNNFVYFIEHGCARTFLLVDGKEITNWFSQEGDITFSSNALYYQKPGFEYVELLEESLLYAIPIRSLNHLYETNIEIANWGRVIHQDVLLKMQTLRLDRVTLSAKERYEKLLKEDPGLFNRATLGHIASYLGMTQQHLSSLRAHIRF